MGLPEKPISRVEMYQKEIAENVGTIANLLESGGGGSGSGDKSGTVDAALSDDSENPVQNKVLKKALDGKITMPSGGMTGQVLKKTASGVIWGNDVSGESDYNALSNLPSINGVALSGDKSAEDLKFYALIKLPGFIEKAIYGAAKIAFMKPAETIARFYAVDESDAEEYGYWVEENMKMAEYGANMAWIMNPDGTHQTALVTESNQAPVMFAAQFHFVLFDDDSEAPEVLVQTFVGALPREILLKSVAYPLSPLGD